eukprot:CAMPEP_0195507622 /NCGR_PEP_ID=MMETSP0794_2-20130614/1032_1 /TAXON_ID=515487 /ORGANISM="Stephanopyxis turris, Strain CCMP 815" /LENGTH=446 /DNA_ID=CAMNT_0040634367 /DNA_START=117 /DNA_END=1454 /DNA_ORIENTATION=-
MFNSLSVITLVIGLSISKANVSCGGHSASACSNCPQGNGAAWCNGDCSWVNNQCVQTAKTCGGGIMASSCSQCLSGENGCGNVDCAWHKSTGLCRDAFSDDVRTASVHLFYDSPSTVNRPAWWFQRVIPTASADATYFSTNGHGFGYGGIQQVDDSTGRVLFSLWDQGGCDQDVSNCDPDDLAQTVACGTGVTCKGFGGEGTGRQSFYDRSYFEDNKAYYFATQAAYLGNRRMEYTGYFLDSGTWRLLSRIQVSTNTNEKWWIDGMYSFVEQWAPTQTTKTRGALYGPSYVADTNGANFAEVKRGTFSHGTLENHEHVNAWQAGSDKQYAIGIETGGDVVQETNRGEVFTYDKQNPYPELERFARSISCLNLADSRDEIEACLDIPPATDSPTNAPISTNSPTSTPVVTDPPSPGQTVWCGGHAAATCADCPQGNGAAWCNGDCSW